MWQLQPDLCHSRQQLSAADCRRLVQLVIVPHEAWGVAHTLAGWWFWQCCFALPSGSSLTLVQVSDRSQCKCSACVVVLLLLQQRICLNCYSYGACGSVSNAHPCAVSGALLHDSLPAIINPAAHSCCLQEPAIYRLHEAITHGGVPGPACTAPQHTQHVMCGYSNAAAIAVLNAVCT
jgi:hypothetical protein